MPLSNKKEWVLVNVIRVLEKISFLAWWVFIASLCYGGFLWIVNYVNDPYIPIYLRLAISSFSVFLFGLFLISILDDGKACIEFPERKD